MRESGLLATCYLLTYYYACCCFPGLLYISLSYIRSSPSLPFSPPPHFFSFLFGWGLGGEGGGWGRKGGGSKPPPPLPPERGVGGTKSPPPPFHNNHPMQLKLKQKKLLQEIYIYWLGKCVWPPPPPPGLRHDGDSGKIHRNISIKDCYRWYCTGDR